MYFEAIPLKVRKVASAAEAAELAKSGNIPSCVALEWSSDNGTFLAVSDVHIDDTSFGETAIIQKKENGFFKKESITVAWIKTVQQICNYFKESETAEMNIPVSVIIGKPTDQTAWFTCGCCGCGFKDLVKKQLEFDQDNGYGICTKCEKYYR